MRRILVPGLTLALAAAVASPLYAGAVYVPYAADVTVGAVQYETQIWASNRGSESRRFSTVFIPAGANGTVRTGVVPKVVGVQPGASILVDNIAPTSTVGMLEINGAPQLLISARLVPADGGSGRLGGHLPVISSENLIPASAVAHLQGITRDQARITDLMVVNVAKVAASCTVTPQAANGAALGNPAQVTLAPLTVNRYADVMNVLGQLAITGVRVGVTCNQTFYAFALTLDSQNSAVTVINPAESLTSTLLVPGDDGGGGGGGGGGGNQTCGDGKICFSRPGVFYIPTPSESVRRETFSLATADYSKAHFTVEVENGGWKSPTSGLHSLFWLAINRHFRLLGFAAAKGPSAHTVLFRHGIDIEAVLKPRFEVGFRFEPGSTVKVDFLWDGPNRLVELRLLDTAGNVLARITDRTNKARIQIGDGEDLTADFSFQQGHNPNEPPTYGWKYKNLSLEVFELQE